MKDLDNIHREVELVAASIASNVARVHEAVNALVLSTRALLGDGGPIDAAIDAWFESTLVEQPTGYLTIPEVTVPPSQALRDRQQVCASRLVAGDQGLRRRLRAIAQLESLAALYAQLPGIAWVYFQDRINHSYSICPAIDPSGLVPHDFDWYAYHSFAIASPEANPARELRWSPPNIDYGGKGAICCVSKPVYVGEEFVGVWSIDVILSALHSELAVQAGRRIAQNQQNFICDFDGLLIAHPHIAIFEQSAGKGDADRRPVATLGGDYAKLDLAEMARQGAGELEMVDGQGGRFRVAYRAVPSVRWIVFAAFPVSEMIDTLRSSFARAFDHLKSGDLSFRLESAGSDVALHELTASYNTMAAALQENLERRERAEADQRRLAMERERMSRELEIASTIQLSMIPAEVSHPEFEFGGRMQAADEVGGDFYDVIVGRDGALWLTIGDVSSHGLGSGLVMMIAQATFETLFEADAKLPADQVFRQANRLLHRNAVTRMGGKRYVTGQVLVYRGDGRFECAGSHLWPLVYDPRSERIRRVEMVGPWLGVMAELPSVPVSDLVMAPGEVLCLYSDGLLEARDANGEIYDLERFERSVARALREQDRLAAAAEQVLADVERWAPVRDDDRTLLFVKRRG